jgi:hypothetical protein
MTVGMQCQLQATQQKSHVSFISRKTSQAAYWWSHKPLCNIGQFELDYTAKHPRKQLPSYVVLHWKHKFWTFLHLNLGHFLVQKQLKV